MAAPPNSVSFFSIAVPSSWVRVTATSLLLPPVISTSSLRLPVIQLDAKLLILLGRVAGFSGVSGSYRGYRSHPYQRRRLWCCALITTGCGAASPPVAPCRAASPGFATAGRAAFAAGRAAFAAGRAASLPVAPPSPPVAAGAPPSPPVAPPFTLPTQFPWPICRSRHPSPGLIKFNACRSAGRARSSPSVPPPSFPMPLPSAQFSAEPTLLLGVFAYCDDNVNSRFPSRSAARRPLLLASNVSFCLSTLSSVSKQLHRQRLRPPCRPARRKPRRYRRELHRFFAAHRSLRLVFLQRRNLRFAQGVGLRQRERATTHAHTHSIIAILRFILFRSILIPSMMKKSLRVSAPSYHVSSLLCN